MPNFRFPEDSSDYGRGGLKTKARLNIQAIALLKQLEDQNRQASPAEQETLSKYVGWGGIPHIFNPTPAPDWEDLATQLKEALDEKEWDSAFESTLNAHYTNPEVIHEIYQGLAHLGFRSGRILDPSMGTGNFLGLMPERMAERSEVTGIELDSLTGRIAKQLYPEAELHVRGFEETPLPENHFDLAISNVPFGDYKIIDPEYKHLDPQIHNYFFARSLDRVRPGGLVAFITSTGTLQSKSNQNVREWLAERSNLVGAIRLPGSAFKQSAGTEVTTDLIILQKHGPNLQPDQKQWIALADTPIQGIDGQVLQTNEYYARHPELMLGELSDDKLHPGRLALKSDGRDLAQAIHDALETFPSKIYQPSALRFKDDGIIRESLPEDVSIKNFGYFAQNDQIWQRRDNYLELTPYKGKRAGRVAGMLQIRDAAQAVFAVQIHNGSNVELLQAQAKLNEVYDRFVSKHGLLSDSANSRLFKLDPDAQLLLALEQLNKKTDQIEKAAVFSKRTIRPQNIEHTAETSQEALLASLNRYGRVVPDYMSSLLGQDSAMVLDDLKSQELIFNDPSTETWQPQDQYLSGNVRQKLKEATAAAESNPEYAANVTALEAVQPRDLGPGEIEVKLGAPWIPSTVIQNFANELLEIESGIEVQHSVRHAAWAVTPDVTAARHSNNTTTYGTDDLTAMDLLQRSLNLQDATVYGKDADGNRFVRQDATLNARMKQQQIQERFKGWIWQDFERSEQLCDRYNTLFNDKVVRSFANPNLEMPGSNPEITLRDHQKDAVWRSLQSDTTLMAHVVGAGKTFSMVASALEMRRLGIAQKPMIVVPNHMLVQFTRELQQLYPNAKVLAATENDSKASKRKELMARIGTGDWDAVVVTHSAFTRLPLSKSQSLDYYQSQKDELETLLTGGSKDRNSNAMVKILARERRKLKAKIDKIQQSEQRDDGITFDQLGVDALFVDEAHFWKNLGRSSKLRDIAGLSNTSSTRAEDGFMKCRLIRKNGGRVVFATGTPVSNSIAELYTMQRFLQPESLDRQGIANFDGWVAAFAEKVTQPEIDTTGRFKVRTRLTRFSNVPELMTLFRETADIQTAEQLNLPVPQVDKITVTCEASDPQLRYMEHLIDRAEAVKNKEVEPDQDNMLCITTDGRRSALDLRLVDPAFPAPSRGKVNQAITNIHSIWEGTHENQLTQMVFCDLGTPKKGDLLRFSVYDTIMKGLIAKGIPAEEIAFIHDAPKGKDKETLFAKVRDGKVRVLLGSTEKCGVGMNVQDRLIAEHHIDPPWRPSDIEQREGRIIRQGNRNEKVMVLTYVTQGRDGQLGFDSYSWQTLARKAEMVSQVMNGDSSLREVDDVSSSALSFDEIKAIATGNPLIMEKATVDNRVTELQRFQQAYRNDRYTAQRRVTHTLPLSIKRLKKEVKALKSDIERRQDTRGDKFKIQLGSRTFNKREEAGQILKAALAQADQRKEIGTQEVGRFAGFAVAVNQPWKESYLELRSDSGMIYPIRGGETPKGIIRSLENTLTKFEEKLEKSVAGLGQQEKDMDALSKNLEQPFEYEAELLERMERQQEINTELGLYKDDDNVAEEGEEAETETVESSQEETESSQELVDIDAINSGNADLSWLDGAEEAEAAEDIEPCESTPEVIEALQNLGNFKPDKDKIEAATETVAEIPIEPVIEEDTIASEVPAETPAEVETETMEIPSAAIESPDASSLPELEQETTHEPKAQPREEIPWQPFSSGEQLGLFSTLPAEPKPSSTPEPQENQTKNETSNEAQASPTKPTPQTAPQPQVTNAEEKPQPTKTQAQTTPTKPLQQQQTKEPPAHQPKTQKKAPPAEKLTSKDWPKIAAAIGKPQQYRTWVSQQLGGGQLSRMGDRAFKQDLTDYQTNLKQVKNWYRAAKRLQKPPKYLERITEIGKNYKTGTPVSQEAQTAMKGDLNQLRYQQLSKSIPEADPSLPRLAAEALKLGYAPKQVMGILSLDPKAKKLRSKEGEQSSLKYCRKYLMEGKQMLRQTNQPTHQQQPTKSHRRR